MPLFNAEQFANEIVADLARLRLDMRIMKEITPEDRKEVLKKVLNKIIDIPGLPDFLEPLLFNFAVEYMEHFLKVNLEKTNS